ncbi:putative short-chain dehydrogenases/reductase [Schizopora paradoxa]|uniref:Putative short-chain dehydrogenases/reductase n=1 Tax=Schizopora paradoxa TaxID=27342 RepID=A0A0H2RLX5_9AGAM|nr:putative short-chain dehydrogenases/reductase [Schizopora paradoxa]
MPSYVITGTSRGLGLGFVKALSLEPDNTVFALARNVVDATQLSDFVKQHVHKNIHIIEADNTHQKSMQNAADEVSKHTGGKLDMLINNAALIHHERDHLTLDSYPNPELLEQDLNIFLRTNVLGTIHTINAFLPLLLAGSMKKCIILASPLGTIKMTLATNFAGATGYGISKAAMSLATAKYAARFRNEGLAFLLVNPGFVKTMPGPKDEVEKLYDFQTANARKKFPDFEGAITVEDSVRDQLVLFDRVTIANTGDFLNRDGTDGDSRL